MWQYTDPEQLMSEACWVQVGERREDVQSVQLHALYCHVLYCTVLHCSVQQVGERREDVQPVQLHGQHHQHHCGGAHEEPVCRVPLILWCDRVGHLSQEARALAPQPLNMFLQE